MTALTWFFRILLVLFLIRLLLRLLFRSRQPLRPRPPPSGTIERSGGELVRDPHCGTYVPKSSALALGSGESTVYFCSAKCRQAYVTKS